MKISKLTLLLAPTLLLTACAGLVPTEYEQSKVGGPSATITLSSPQGYYVAGTTYERPENCGGQQRLKKPWIEKGSQTYKVDANQKFVLTVQVSETKAYGHSCHYTLTLPVKENGNYEVATLLDKNKNICTNTVVNTANPKENIEVGLVDGILSAFQASSDWCKGVEPVGVVANDEFSTGLYRFTWGQALAYDYTPKRLKPK